MSKELVASSTSNNTNNENKKALQEINNKTSSLLEMLENNPVSLDDGLDFLNVKNNAMISYLIEITLLMKLKNKSKNNEDGKKQGMNRLSELKLLLDKYRPMEKKLQYQIDKILSQQITSGNATTFEENALFGHTTNDDDDDDIDDTIDPSLLKPNPESMLGSTNNNEEEKQKEKKKKSSSVYRAPRLTSIHFQQNDIRNESQKEKELKLQQKQRKQMSQSELLQTLKHQYTDTPEEDDYQGGAANTTIGGTTKWKKYQEKQKEKIQFEEKNMTRLITTKKEKKERNEMIRSNESNLYSLTDLGNLSSGIHAFQEKKRRDKEKLRRVHNGDDKDEHIFVDDRKKRGGTNEKSRTYKNSLQRDLFDDGGKSSGKKNKKQRR